MNLALAVSLDQEGKLSEADAAYREILAAEPLEAQAMHGLGMILFRAGRIEDALEYLAASTRERPHETTFAINYAVVLGTQGRHAQAAEILRAVIAADPASVSAHDNYGIVLDKLHKLKEAQSAFRKVVELDPNYFEGLLHLGISLRHTGQKNESLHYLQKAKAVRPNDAELLRQLAAMAAESGDALKAIACYSELLQSPGANLFDYSALVFSTHYNPSVPRRTLLAGAKAWAGIYADPLTAAAIPPVWDRSPTRQLRVGYISSDFREHPAGRLLHPVLGETRPPASQKLLLFGRCARCF